MRNYPWLLKVQAFGVGLLGLAFASSIRLSQELVVATAGSGRDLSFICGKS